jgi:ubiquinone/menaquinone biosynthesis C-methylase UbiE
MNAANVGQWSVLNRIFADTVAEFAPSSLAVLGCSTGNGFEHIDPQVTQRIVGIDINADYLRVLEQRHRDRLRNLGLICSDVASCSLKRSSLNLIYAALIFEYVDPERVLPEAATWLKPGGVLAAVLQLPSPVANTVSDTPFASLQALTSIMRLVDPAAFEKLADRCGLTPIRSWHVSVRQGKGFYIAYYEREKRQGATRK